MDYRAQRIRHMQRLIESLGGYGLLGLELPASKARPPRIWQYKSFIALLACTVFMIGLEMGYDYGMDTMRSQLLGSVEDGTAPVRDVAYRPLPEIDVIYGGPERGI